MKKFLLLVLIALFNGVMLQAQSNVIDEVIWVIGDDAILLSDVENMRLHMQLERQRMQGDPYCVIPEQMAIQKLFLHQAKLDSIDVSDSRVYQHVEIKVNDAINQVGSQEKLEEYLGKSINAFREELRISMKENAIVQEVQAKLVENMKVTPSEVRSFFNKIPQDSLPYIETTVEVQIMTIEPTVSLTEIDNIKEQLRDFTEQVTGGKKQFSTLARLYSQDKVSAERGGELGFVGKGLLDPEFAAVAFELNDPKRISRVVKSEYGYHIIQLVEKRGDRINVRHILLKPEISAEELAEATQKLDSIRTNIVDGKFSFEEAVPYLSADKDTRNNQGLVVNNDESRYSDRTGTSRFEMSELPAEIGKVVYTLKVGDISKPFTMINSKGQEIAAIVKLKSRIDGHKANLSEDFQALRSMMEAEKREQIINKWITKKQKETYIRIHDNWKNCDFEKNGWVQK
ncbi:MAG: peptidylprolyl isomerase [Dysgonamonadaceae bacterium]|jgi:peptidyl-prolyl cis-trans isomerase SurA|nr:peptidylprolyl isomerase [Dysgonamonadaceae bacterium]